MGIVVKAPGSCGELAQGMINGQNFLITCPISVYAQVEVGFGRQQTRICAGEKTRAAVSKTLEYLQQPAAGLEIIARSELLAGKGMASSSADIAAACQATAQCFGRMLTPDEITDIALAIEPTDGVYYPEIMMLDHVNGSIRRGLGVPPAISIAVFDVGGEVDTQRFNQRSDLANLNAAKESMVRQAVDLIITGLRRGDSQMIGQGATLSALANQKILYKPCLDKVIEIAECHGAVGVNSAHSGTVLGILFPASESLHISSCIADVTAACSSISYWRTVEMISGGLVIAEGRHATI